MPGRTHGQRSRQGHLLRRILIPWAIYPKTSAPASIWKRSRPTRIGPRTAFGRTPVPFFFKLRRRSSKKRLWQWPLIWRTITNGRYLHWKCRLGRWFIPLSLNRAPYYGQDPRVSRQFHCILPLGFESPQHWIQKCDICTQKVLDLQSGLVSHNAVCNGSEPDCIRRFPHRQAIIGLFGYRLPQSRSSVIQNGFEETCRKRRGRSALKDFSNRQLQTSDLILECAQSDGGEKWQMPLKHTLFLE